MIRTAQSIGFLLLVFWVALSAPWLAQAGVEGDGTRLDRATLQTLMGEREVALPYKLERGEFDPRGSRVRFRLQHHLDEQPTKPLGIYMGKMSLSGQISVKGD